MFWNDIAEMKREIKQMKRSVDELHGKIAQNRCICNSQAFWKQPSCGVITEENECEPSRMEHIESMLEEIKEAIEDACSDEQVLAMFENHFKDVEKLDLMIGELKGCILLARTSLVDKKDFEQTLRSINEVSETVKHYWEDTKKTAEYALSLHNQHFKIDAIYKYLFEPDHEEKIKKPKKPKNSV